MNHGNYYIGIRLLLLKEYLHPLRVCFFDLYTFHVIDTIHVHFLN